MIKDLRNKPLFYIKNGLLVVYHLMGYNLVVYLG